MSSIDDSKLTNIKLDDTNPDILPINAQIENDSSQMRPNQAINIDENYIRTFSSLFLDQINTQDVNAILESQQQIINRLDFTNKNLTNANKSSNETFNSFGIKDYQSYIVLLNTMKQDLEFIFKRIRLMKNKLQLKHPLEYENALKKVQQNRKLDDSEDEDESFVENKSQTQRKISVIKEEEAETNARQFQNSPSLKERSMSNVSSTSSTTSAMVANLIQTAKNRISTSGKDIVNGFFNNAPTVTIVPTSGQAPAPVLSNYLSNKLENESLNKNVPKTEAPEEIPNEN